jgi:hypothetical protein
MNKYEDPANYQLEGLTLVLTCQACPEQYDVFNANDEQVGYLRLRHGNFTVECPDVFGKLVYEAQPKGDGFFYEDEREFYLTEAVQAINKHLQE